MVWAAVKAPDLAVAVHRRGPRPQLGGRVVTIAAAIVIIWAASGSLPLKKPNAAW